MQTNSELRPFKIEVPQAALDDLQDRLARTRWATEIPLPPPDPAAEPRNSPVAPGWEEGVPLAYVQRLVAYWREGFDWRAQEARLNAHPQFLTEIEGQDVHFLHVRSPEPGAMPLILTHGWPASCVEYLDLIGPLTDPRAHGGDPADAFHVVVPDWPGFAFSSPLRERGWNIYRVAAAWVELMRRLGYERYGAHGNDGGSQVSPEMGRLAPQQVRGVHVTQLFSFPSGDPAEFEGLSADDMSRLEFLQAFNTEMGGFSALLGSKPQNVAHALADSPAGQLAWSAQLLGGDTISPDFVLTNVSLYWLTNTSASANRNYYETQHAQHPSGPTTVPTGLASFAHDFRPVRRLAERDHSNIVSWNEYPRGGHWATQDAPDLLLQDIRQFFRALR
ncbi:MAG TPA: epoxide hydrolase [Chloroflexota bacterium]|nr:epoxide hydrolase [Chloroflexota bacterium]